MRSTTGLAGALLLAASLGTAQEPASVSLPEPLARVLTDYQAAWQARDAARLAALFTEDGFVLSRGTPPVVGRAAIEEHYEGHGGPLSLRAFAFATEGAVGYIIGGYATRAGEPDAGKFTLTLRRSTDGRWLIRSDMDNGNSRP
jgi:ketosteroid isomerase-like protein